MYRKSMHGLLLIHFILLQASESNSVPCPVPN